jgi:PhnB protein
MKSANSYLNFNGNAEEAFNFYKSVLGGEFLAMLRYSDMQSEMPGDSNLIAHIALPIEENHILMGCDTPGGNLTIGNNIRISLDAESREEAKQIFNSLSEDGKVKMPLQQTEFADKFGMCADKFGVQWIVMYAGTN